MLNWLKKAALWALGRDKKEKKPTKRTTKVTKQLAGALTEEDIARLTGQKAKKALARKTKGK